VTLQCLPLENIKRKSELATKASHAWMLMIVSLYCCHETQLLLVHAKWDEPNYPCTPPRRHRSGRIRLKTLVIAVLLSEIPQQLLALPQASGLSGHMSVHSWISPRRHDQLFTLGRSSKLSSKSYKQRSFIVRLLTAKYCTVCSLFWSRSEVLSDQHETWPITVGLLYVPFELS